MYTEQYNQLNRQRVDWQTEEEVRLGWLTIYRIRSRSHFMQREGDLMLTTIKLLLSLRM